MPMKPIPADFGIDLYTRLLNARRTMLQPALKVAVKAVGVRAINADLQRLVPSEALDHLAGLGLRGERVFPTPAVLRQAPTLIGYYRMLLGISRKEFRQPGGLVMARGKRPSETAGYRLPYPHNWTIFADS